MLFSRLFASSPCVPVSASVNPLRRSSLSAAVRRLLMGGASLACIASLPAFAQEQPAPAQQQTPPQTSPSVSTLDEIKVVGYQASLGKALNVKRNADAIVDAISAEDIGKFPDTNVAESLSRLSGITVDRQFGEGEKVSILGTDPALNRVLLNGQTIASTSWGGDPNDPDSRSFNYSTLAPEVVGLMEVYKTPEARIDEGSIGGTVIVHTRKPLDLDRNTLTGTVSYGYNDGSDEGKPNASALYSWKNQDQTLGALASVMHSQRVLRRDGVEIFGYDNVQGAGFPPGVVGNNTGVFPTSINTALFQQTRKRDGVSAALQWKPDSDFELNLTGLYVKESFDNYNQSRYGYWGSTPGDAQALGFENGIATSGTFGDQSNTYLDGYLRNSQVSTGSIHLRTDWHGEGWNASSQVGYTSSQGGAERIYGIQFRNLAGYSYAIDGRRTAMDYSTDPTNAAAMQLNNASASHSPQYDKERYLQLDFDHAVEWGPFTQILTGIKLTNHATGQSSYSRTWTPNDGSTLAAFSPGTTPSGYLDGLSTSTDMQRWSTINSGAIGRYIGGLEGNDGLPISYAGNYSIQEQNRAWFLQGNFSGERYRGNIGVRYVHSRDSTDGYSYAPGGGYTPVNFLSSYGKWLPSFNIAYDLRDDLMLRFAASKVIARPRYTNMTPYVATDDTTLTASTGNPGLSPYESTNLGASLEWYFSDSSLLSGEFFSRDISNYILTTVQDRVFFNNATGGSSTYQTSVPTNAGDATVRGVALNLQHNFGNGFGVVANYTYSDSNTDGDYSLPYNSRNAYNISPYYEQGKWSARVNLGWRSEYFTQIGRLNGQQMTDAFTQVDASFGYQATERLRVALEATNLLDETYFSYIGNKNQPYYIYKNGRSFMLSLNFKL
ncbi:TonB-dependent receptor [Xanthomonas euvesicatoria]|uniref:TonB-dependent receptor n=1 Tax=Xanthomonas euvesicatoria TaxID=456327 RepID=UPI001C483487|nr:TonB-dependent receptor [Xanthomonas euvesicatoria]MBV6840072.1 TonB-dependent receptor [Xanthomonas campestris pv. fici]